MHNCALCKKEATAKHENGSWFCNDCLMDLYRSNHANRYAIRLAQVMKDRGIKEGSFWWIYNNIRGMKYFHSKRGLQVKMNWKHTYKNSGLWKTIQGVFVWYFLS